MRRILVGLALISLLPMVGSGQERPLSYSRSTPLVDGSSFAVTSPGGFNVYNLGGPGTTDYEVAKFYWTGNVFVIQTTAGGSGSFRSMQLASGGGGVNVPTLTPTNDTYNLGVSSSNQFANAFLTRSVQGGKSLSLTDGGAAAAAVNVAIGAGSYAGGEIVWATTSTDATDYRVTSGRIRFAGVNKAGTMTCTGNVVGTDLTASSNANTLVCTWTFVAATASCDIKVACTDNTAGTQTMAVIRRADMPTLNALTFP